MSKSGFFQMDDSEPKLYWRVENPIFYLVYFLDKSNPTYVRDMRERLRDMQCTRLVALSVAVDNMGVDSPVDNVDNHVDNV